MKPDPNGNKKMLTCDGTCDKHEGFLRHVHITHPPSKTDWGIFVYCDNAIAEDISRGLKIELLIIS